MKSNLAIATSAASPLLLLCLSLLLPSLPPLELIYYDLAPLSLPCPARPSSCHDLCPRSVTAVTYLDE
jgi:hypothetical protein